MYNVHKIHTFSYLKFQYACRDGRLFVAMHMDDQLVALRSIWRKEGHWVLHIDATGNVLRWRPEKSERPKPVYYYAAVTPSPLKGEPCIPLFEFVTDVHNVPNRKTAIISWFSHVQNVVSPPSVIVIDWSWALLHALVSVVCLETVQEHISRLWRRILLSQPDDKPCIRFCIAHFVKSV